MQTITSTFALASVGILLITGCNVPQFSAKRDFEKIIPINSQVNVNVKTFNGNITVTPSDLSEIQLVAHAKAYGNTQEEADSEVERLVPEIDTTASAITIECKRRTQSMMFSGSVSLELKVPTGWPLDLVTTNGTVSTTDSRSSVTIDTSNGKIEVKGANGPMLLSTSNGTVTVENSSGNIQAKTSNGKMQLIGCSLVGKCKLNTSNGAISVSFSEKTPIRLDASTSNGSIKFKEGDIDVAKKSKSRLTGILFGDAQSTPSTSLDLETSNGTITIMSSGDSATPQSIPTEDILNAN